MTEMMGISIPLLKCICNFKYQMPKGETIKSYMFKASQNWFFINLVFLLLWVSVSSQASWETIPASLWLQESTKRNVKAQITGLHA